MRKTICGAVALSLVLALGVSAQGHAHGAQSTGDTAQAAGTAQGMMQHRMGHMQDMRARMEGMMQMRGQAMGGMGAMGGGQHQGAATAGTCIVSGSEGALSAVLLGSASDLTLSEEQTTALRAILARAQNEALEALTLEQRERLEAAPARPPCQQLQPDAGAGPAP